MNRQAAIELYRRGEEATVAALLDQSARLEALERRVAQLERDSTNSHKPPSSDGPKKKRGRAERGASGRKPGGQPGHPGHPPAPTPPEAIGQAVEHKPATCDSCGRAFSEADPTRVVERRRVVELPHIQPWVIQHVFYKTQCPCGYETRLPVPDWVMTGVGEKLQALMAYLTSEARMSRRVLQKTLAEVFHVRCALGAIQNRLEDTSEALSPMTQELEAALPHESVVHSDETGSPHNRVGHWLWVFVTARFVFFTIQASRGSKVLKEVLGEAFAGILPPYGRGSPTGGICDRFSAYLKYQKDRAVGLIQFCWAHLIREARALPPVMAQGSGELFSRRTRQHLGALFRLWHAFRRGFAVRRSRERNSSRKRRRLSPPAGEARPYGGKGWRDS